MSTLFNNYTPERLPFLPPDNTHGHLKVKPDYDEVIVWEADNTHCFTIPHKKSELFAVKAIYNQGVETKLVYQWTVGMVDNGIFRWDFEGDDEHPYSQISINMPGFDTFNFNLYNQDIRVQLHNCTKEGYMDMSPIYKIKLIPAIKDKTRREE